MGCWEGKREGDVSRDGWPQRWPPVMPPPDSSSRTSTALKRRGSHPRELSCLGPWARPWVSWWHGHAGWVLACLRMSVLSTEERSCELTRPSRFAFPSAQQLFKPAESPNPSESPCVRKDITQQSPLREARGCPSSTGKARTAPELCRLQAVVPQGSDITPTHRHRAPLPSSPTTAASAGQPGGEPGRTLQGRSC